ncbi:hypothetical protein [Lacticaseibacillus camelliae]|nr:hypothetical protein [Lacticaseibacillus camelliae]
MELNQKHVVAAQLETIKYPKIIAHTENGSSLTIETNEKQRDDPAFWQAISAILKAHLWVPVSTRLHQLTDSDWLMPDPA